MGVPLPGFSDNVSTKTIVHLNDEKRACFSDANSICFFPWQISEELKERLLEFHKKAGLGFGAYDFLERGDDVIFLECNPGGAWLWLEMWIWPQCNTGNGYVTYEGKEEEREGLPCSGL